VGGLAKRTIAAEALKPFEKTTTRKVTPDKNQQARLGRKYHITKRRHVLVVRALEQPCFSARGRAVQNLTVRKLAQCRDVVHPAPKVFTMSTVNLACDSALLKPICLRTYSKRGVAKTCRRTERIHVSLYSTCTSR
jgi:hypothetical protein